MPTDLATSPPDETPAVGPSLGHAQLRIDVAVAQLIRPGEVTLDRDRLDESPAARELLAAEQAEITDLERRHAAHLRLGRHGQAARTLAALIAARRRVEAAEAPRTARRADVPSLLDQLLDALPGSANADHGAPGTGAHRAALALTVLDLIAAIQRTVGNRDHATLAADLRGWAARSGEWRTTSPGYLQDAAVWAEQWVTAGRTLLDPPKRWSLPAACPRCGQRTAYVRDDSNEVVRKPALELDRTTGEARCLTHGCGARWAPDQLLFLARLLEQQRGGADDPEAALEMAG